METASFSFTRVLHDKLRALKQNGFWTAHLQLDVSIPICRGQAEKGAVGDTGAYHQLNLSAVSAEDASQLIMDPTVPSKSPFWKN